MGQCLFKPAVTIPPVTHPELSGGTETTTNNRLPRISEETDTSEHSQKSMETQSPMNSPSATESPNVHNVGDISCKDLSGLYAKLFFSSSSEVSENHAG